MPVTVKDDPFKYGKIKKVYSIWLCTETAQCRANSIEKYDIKREIVVGSNSDDPRYDIMTAVIINISEKHDTEGTNNELIRLLTDLFDERINGAEKVAKLKDTYGLKLTREVESEVSEMCTYATAMETKGLEKGKEEGKITARYEDGMSIDNIAEKSKVSVEFVKEVLIKNGMLQ